MQFTIYSIGDAAFLEQILNSVAMICGTNNLKKIVAIGLLLGFFAVVIQSIFEGGKQINVQHVFIGWIMYSVFYGPSCIIKIEDVYSGQVRVVANVPIGVGITGGVVSNIGYGLTSMFEQGFQISGSVSNSKYNESLKLLSETRRAMYNNAIYSALDQSQGGGNIDTKQSIINYIKECTLIKIDLNQESLTKIMTQEIDKSIKFTSSVFGTTLYLNSNGTPQNYTCSEAWPHIQSLISNLATGPLSNSLNSILNINTIAGNSASNKINDSLQMMGLSSLSANMYVKLALLEPLYNEASMGKYQDLQDYSSALMINQAIQQRNVQWTSEQTLFMTTVRPLVTFFEGFVYALTPIMAFIIVLGGMGIKLIGRYIQVILWIQLWLPVLSITNLYIYMASREELIAINSTGASALDSFYALNATTDKLDTWIATGGMLAAATPLIALFVITGSSYAFTNIAGRLNGTDFTNEKINTPDAIQNGPVMSSAPENNFNATSGGLNSGAESLISKINVGQNIQKGLASAREEVSQSASAFTSSLSNAVMNSATESDSYQKLSSIGQAISSNHSEEAQAIKNQAKSFMEQNNISDQHSDAVTGAFTLNATAGLGGGVNVIIAQAEVGGKGGASIASTTSDNSTITTSDINNYAKQNSLTDSQKAALTTQLAGSLLKQNTQNLSKTFGDTAAEELANTSSKLVNDSNKYNQIDSLSNSLVSGTNMDLQALGGIVASNYESQQLLNNAYNYSPQAVKEEANNLERAYINNGMTPTTAMHAARIAALTNQNNFTDSNSATNALNSTLEAIGTASGRNLGSFNNYGKNEGISNQNVHNQSLTQPGRKFGETSNKVNSGINENKISDGNNIPGKDDVIDQFNTKRDKVNQYGKSGAIDPEALASAENRIMNNPVEMGIASQVFGTKDNVVNKIGRISSSIGGALGNGMENAEKTFGESISNLGKMNDEQLKAFQSDMVNNRQENTEKYGSFIGGTINGFNSAYKSAVGAAVSGYQSAKEWISGEKSDLSEAAKNMTLEEKGAYYLGAYQAAFESGVDKASEFMNSYGANFKNTMKEMAKKRYKLSDNQAAIYAESFDTDPTKMKQAITSLKEEFAEKDENKNIKRNENGQPILSDYNDKLTDKMVSIISNSTRAGKQDGSYLQDIRNYNIVSKKFR